MSDSEAVSDGPSPVAVTSVARGTGELEADAIGVVQDTVIGMASSAPAASVGLTLAALVAAVAYGTGPIIIITAIPMLVIANAYRRLNMWNVNCGASYEWVGRAIDPNLGFITGWLMIAGYVIATVSGVEVLGPSVLAVFGSTSTNTWGIIGIATAVGLAMLALAVLGIRITARTQVGIAVIEYVILIGFAIVGIYAVASHWHGTYHFSSGWWSPTGIKGGGGDAVAGFLVAVFIFTGWDGAVYVNEEVKQRRRNPGRAALLAVGLLAIIYTISFVGLQGTVQPAKLQANSASALVYVAQALGGSGWAKVMALGLALSVIATTGTGIVLTARIVFSMARDRVLPAPLAQVSRRYATPVNASVVVGVLIVGLAWVYLLATSVQNAFTDVVDVAGILFAVFYILTALATITYYRQLVTAGLGNALVLGILPLAAAGFLGWIVVKSLLAAPSGQLWSLVGIVVVGIVLLALARFVERAPFFQLSRERYEPETEAAKPGS
ncbi:MAG TPA: APC family permease [Streptosporangiaceae bacterium]